MRKLINLTMAGIIVAGMGIGLSGCSDESKEKTQTTISTPNGKTTETHEVKIDKSGQNPPAAPAEKH
jgi:hypothetical protein